MPSLSELLGMQPQSEPVGARYATTLSDLVRRVDPSWFRADGSAKGSGFLGMLPYHDGRASSEISIGVDGREMPSIVPTLDAAEVNHLLMGGRPTPEIVRKAAAHAEMRANQGQSAFAGPGETPMQWGVPWRRP